MTSDKLTGLHFAFVLLKERHLPHTALIRSENIPLFEREARRSVFTLVKEPKLRRTIAIVHKDSVK